MTTIKRIITWMYVFCIGILVWLGFLAEQERSHDLPEEKNGVKPPTE